MNQHVWRDLYGSGRHIRYNLTEEAYMYSKDLENMFTQVTVRQRSMINILNELMIHYNSEDQNDENWPPA